jgi:hypothetical protein
MIQCLNENNLVFFERLNIVQPLFYDDIIGDL